MDAKPTCRLEGAVGRSAPCAGHGCAFWEEYGSGGHCVFDELDLSGRDELVRWLLALRHEIGPSDRREFYERLNAGKSD